MSQPRRNVSRGARFCDTALTILLIVAYVFGGVPRCKSCDTYRCVCSDRRRAI